MPQGEAISGRGCSACSVRCRQGLRSSSAATSRPSRQATSHRAFRLLGNARRGVRAGDLTEAIGSSACAAPRACSRRSPACAGLGRTPLPTRLAISKGSRVAFAATLSDVDTEENYRRLRRKLAAAHRASAVSKAQGLDFVPGMPLRRGMTSMKLQGRWRLSSCNLRMPFQPSLQAPGRSRQAEDEGAASPCRRRPSTAPSRCRWC